MSRSGEAWRLLAGWRRGALVGLMVYAVVSFLASLLCLANYLGIAAEGYIGAGWLLLVSGLPLTAIEALLEGHELFFVQQMVNLSILALVNWLAIGAIAGYIVGRSKWRPGGSV